jgi:pre-rRNA-processing protein TSR3
MNTYPTTLILRHKRENLKKCSLKGLEPRKDMYFFTYPKEIPSQDLSQYILLSLNAPILSTEDSGKGILLIDGTWRYAKTMLDNLAKPVIAEPRSLPSHYLTAYPRRQTLCPEPERGLASVEALYLAYHILGYDTEGLLDHYFWREPFLNINHLG